VSPAACKSPGRTSTTMLRLIPPTTLTRATPGIERNAPVIAGSASRVSTSAGVVSDVSVSVITGCSEGSKRARIGSFISGGMSARFTEIASRMSCDASWIGFSNSKKIVHCASPSIAAHVDFSASSPLIPKIASSTGRTMSRSTSAGDAPGYGIVTLTIGCWMSGNSSVWMLISAATPKATSAVMVVTVMIGRLIAKSEMNMVAAQEVRIGVVIQGVAPCAPAGRSAGVAVTRTRVPAVSPCAAPMSTVSPAVSPAVTSARSDSGSRTPTATVTRSAAPCRTRITLGATPRSSIAERGTVSASRDVVAMRPCANNPPTSVPSTFGIVTHRRTCRVAGSAAGLTRSTCPVNERPG
jgi:hypothetical protein